ncbi:hypothetical protein [Rhodococcoides kroppenstedtii]|uniref:hypothetical protein n=1 Tax=Rhodococcoides kroppenstedtii TaxID=293050 RepID=UPI0036269221
MSDEPATNEQLQAEQDELVRQQQEAQAKADRIATELGVRARAKAARLAAAQRDHAQGVYDRAGDVDSELQAVSTDAFEEFGRAVAAGDLNAAATAFVEHRAARTAQYHARTAAGAATRTIGAQNSPVVETEGLLRGVEFLDELARLIESRYLDRAQELLAERVPEPPTEVA